MCRFNSFSPGQKAICRSNLTDCQTFLEKNQLDPIIGNRSILMHFWIDLIEPVYLPSIFFLFFCISEKLWYKMCFPSPGSRGRNLTDLPPRSISTGVYIGIDTSQGKIHYVPFVLALRRNRIRESNVVPLPFLLQKLVFRMYLGKLFRL